MPKHYIAQVNISRLIAPAGDPRVADFFDNVPRINELAEQSQGYVWRYDGDYPDPQIAFNMSVWESIEDLTAYVYRSAHVEIFRRRDEWTQPKTTTTAAMWWIEPGTLPSRAEGLRRLNVLEQNGPTQEAFTFAKRFKPPSG